MARPREIDRAKLLAALENYIKKTDVPILAEFALTQNILREQLYEMDELAYAIKKCAAKKEVGLERAALSGDAPVAFVCFSLKQLGWRDTPQIEINNFESLLIQDENGKRMETLTARNGNSKTSRIST